VRLLLVFGFVVTAALGLAFTPPNAKMLGLEPETLARGIYMGTLAFVLLGALLWHYEGRVREAGADLAIWLLLLFILVGGYSNRFELANVAAHFISELMPGATVEGKGGAVMVSRRLDGNFVVRMSVNGVPLPFVFDTGATTVVIRAEDAAKVGIAMDDLSFQIPISTANGNALAAETQIARMSVGQISLLHVPALVTKPGTLNENLLGMSFLDQLGSFTVSGDRLTLKGR